MSPTVSICMPHLNSRPFTDERMESIVAQTLADWELIIIDSSSDDGSGEILRRYVESDSRVRLVQGSRDGIYTNLNRAIELSRGQYVYVATSDDTMAPDLLQRMVDALENNPECGIAHCCLTTIDERSRPLTGKEAWENWPVARYFGDWIHRYHVRRAPHDGLLHFGLGTVYTSLTQLLIRRRVFEDIGVFRTDCSPHADFEWGMRVGLNENIVHLPLSLATWRRHSGQATQPAVIDRARGSGEFRRLRREALRSLRERNPELLRSLTKSRLNDYHFVMELSARRRLARNKPGEVLAILRFSIRHPLFTLRWLNSKLIRRQSVTPDFAEAMQVELTRLGKAGLLEELSAVPMTGRSFVAKQSAA